MEEIDHPRPPPVPSPPHRRPAHLCKHLDIWNIEHLKDPLSAALPPSAGRSKDAEASEVQDLKEILIASLPPSPVKHPKADGAHLSDQSTRIPSECLSRRDSTEDLEQAHNLVPIVDGAYSQQPKFNPELTPRKAPSRLRQRVKAAQESCRRAHPRNAFIWHHGQASRFFNEHRRITSKRATSLEPCIQMSVPCVELGYWSVLELGQTKDGKLSGGRQEEVRRCARNIMRHGGDEDGIRYREWTKALTSEAFGQ